MFRVFVIFSIIVVIDSLSLNNTAILISKYAKVARWGAGQNRTRQSGRSNNQQVIWTPRSSSNTNNGKNEVHYQYPVYKKINEKQDEDKVEKIPGIGEVIQDRFQVRPYFGSSKNKETDLTYLPPARPTPTQLSAPQVVNIPVVPSPQLIPTRPAPAAPPNIRPVSFTATQGTKIPADIYDSPFSSYNPPSDKKPDANLDLYPPNTPSKDLNDNDDSTLNGDSYANIPPANGGPYQSPSPPLTSSSESPPMKHVEYDTFSDFKSHHYYDDAKSNHDDNTHSHHIPSGYGPPKHPPKTINDVYYPPDFPTDQIPSDHGGQDYDGHDHEGKNHDDHGEHDHQEDSHGMPMDDMSNLDTQNNADMTMDLVPPVHGHDFPKYLYDDPHYDHHVYEEVPHTTTPAPEPEKKRVSTTNYSYYYLGRKLWYIPLYFSIYFMVYVTALIIKSIARHKVTLRNEWISANSRSARAMTSNQLKAVDDIHRNFTTALDKASKLYM